MHRCSPSGSSYARRYNVTALAYDWDADGDADLILGYSPLCLVLNQGTGREPSFDGGRPIECNGEPIFGGLGSPQMADWDADGLDDLVAGASRNIVWYRNIGQRGQPKFESPRLLVPLVTPLPSRKPDDGQPGFHHAFCVADFNSDGRLDLLLGDRFHKVVEVGEQAMEQNPADIDRLDALREQYDNLRDEPNSETRTERIERYRKLLRTWQDYEALRLARSTRLERVGHVWYYQRIAVEGQE